MNLPDRSSDRQRQRHAVRRSRWSNSARAVLLCAAITAGVSALAPASASWLSASTGKSGGAAADEVAPHRRPVKTIAPERLIVKTAQGEALVPMFVSRDWKVAQPGVKRAVIVVHGRLRNADAYFATAQTVAAAAGDAGKDALIIAPQFLATADFARHDLPPKHARWGAETWLGGEPAKAPFGISSFEVFDTLVARLADRKLFPNLERIVIVGHSGGAQVVQRYAVVGRAEEMISAAGLVATPDSADAPVVGNSIRMRYVVANPSSYLYMDDTRPLPTERCSQFNRWRYGFVDPALYARADRPDNYEKRYLARRVIYLNGGADNDPNHSALDKSCMAETQGGNRLARGAAYFAHLQKRSTQRSLPLHHVRIEVPGIAHDPKGMFGSKCGLAALFDTPGCDALPTVAAVPAPAHATAHETKAATHAAPAVPTPPATTREAAKPARL